MVTDRAGGGEPVRRSWGDLGPLVAAASEMFLNRIRKALRWRLQWVANFFISTTFPTFSSISSTFAYGLRVLCCFFSCPLSPAPLRTRRPWARVLRRWRTQV